MGTSAREDGQREEDILEDDRHVKVFGYEGPDMVGADEDRIDGVKRKVLASVLRGASLYSGSRQEGEGPAIHSFENLLGRDSFAIS